MHANSRLDAKVEIQEQLNLYYREELENAKSGFDEHALRELSVPQFLSVSSEYLESPVRVMFVGQETRGWIGRLAAYYDGLHGMDAVLGRYERFIRTTSKVGAFVQTLRAVESRLAAGRVGAVAYANLIKMDWKREGSDSRRSLEHSKHLCDLSVRLLQAEIRLLRPSVIIFATGPTYDSLLKRALVDIRTIKVHVPRQLWEFEAAGALCMRVQHPQTRIQSAKAQYPKMFDLIEARFPSVYAAG
ncbi:MAG: hypothetical protein Q7T70_02665 [Polaromonas sp.]|nr:hypothetical protein [Polaromonas sp.]